jgi:hypothetical protein
MVSAVQVRLHLYAERIEFVHRQLLRAPVLVELAARPIVGDRIDLAPGDGYWVEAVTHVVGYYYLEVYASRREG